MKDILLDCLEVDEVSRINAANLVWKLKKMKNEGDPKRRVRITKMNWEELEKYKPTIKFGLNE